MIGRTFANYRVLSQIGQGGMGVVYRAVDLRLDRTVALKVLPPDKSGDRERRARFLQEARAASALNDPHIVTIHDIFTEDDTDVLVMEYVQGRTLREVILDGPDRMSTAVSYVIQAAEGVGAAHAAGIIHRDLKPGNIIVTDRGRVKVLDFGLAKLTGRNDDLATVSGPVSVPGTLLGTIGYMSPEQARGETVDYRSDIFSLGCVFYELLTGERPFQAGHPIGVLHEILFGAIRPPREWRPEVSGDVEAIVLRMLERDVTRRYQSMDAVLSDLRLAQRQLSETSSRRITTSTSPPIPTQAQVLPAVQDVPRPSIPGAPASGEPPSAVPKPLDTAAGASGDVAAVGNWGRSRPRQPKPQRLRTWAPVVAWPAMLIVLFAVPTTRHWLLDRARDIRAFVAERPDEPSASTPSAPLTPYAMTQQGLAFLKRFDQPGNVDRAIALFDRAIAADSEYAPAHAAIAQAYARQGDDTRDPSWVSRAVDAARHAVKLDPYFADGHVALGISLAAAGKTDEATSALQRALSLDPSNGRAWYTLGDIAYALDRRADAANAYKKALELLPDDWRSAVGVGNVAYRSGDYDEAIEWYVQAAASAPDVAVPQNVLGAAYTMKANFAAAARAYQRSIEIRPTGSAYSNLGTALFMEGRFRDSVAVFEKAVEMQSEDPLMWGNLGDAYRHTPGNRERALGAYERAIRLLDLRLSRDPANVRDRSRIALYLAKASQQQRALAELGSIGDLPSRDLNTLYRAAVTYELAGDRAQALRSLEQAVAKGYSVRDVETDPELAGLRQDARYQRLMTALDRPAPR
jgi:serine/threonine protein kinase/tetratricopeptide (TPR) repeat protein